ncbi:uncharacterized protein LOC128961748 [Oppia nitens]|uniref:uncharacterized protein LOC128961748 n=1 Tax=Oppia nitens TaxID=1686743 RepID=UPI0023DAFD04|nr:uncharacterized protein LOC128961748 [Oppia nitens]
MDAFCVTQDIPSEILKKLDECDAIVFSKEGKLMENECMIESSPKGSTVNDRRRLWCSDQQYYQKTRNCYAKKLEAKHKKDGNVGEQISEEQLRNDTLRAMECRKRVFKF